MKKWFSDEERTLLNTVCQLTDGDDCNTLLDKYMKYKRRKRPVLSQNQKYTLYESGGLLQLWFQTSPCRFSTQGKCTMCNYWNGNYIPGLVKKITDEVTISPDYHTLLINTCGSCLDVKEVPQDELVCILDWISVSPVKRVIFETHWTTLTDSMLSLIQSKLPDKIIFYEIGIESTNPDTLYYFLNKPTSIMNMHKIINKVHSHHAKCIMNLVIGVPFLNPEEQLTDASESMRELLENGADYLVLFPINIKPHTLVMDLYQQGQYARIPSRIIADFLLNYFSDSLHKINVSWFGDRLEDDVIPPASCDTCYQDTTELLKMYNEEDETDRRQELLKKIASIQCNCIRQYMSFKKEGTLLERVSRSYSALIEVMKRETT